jgi:2-keto-4-pentenoate hydratase/2-oxohepta-3-ene-1,7-dioic acid hydratase in catechol pathway
MCLGINYAAHAEESARYKREAFERNREYAVYFAKRVDEAVADGQDIPSHSGLTSRLDYEVELAVILGRDAKNVAAADAMDYIFGYTILNDVSARDLQTRHKQWLLGKSLDGFTPMGPCIVTPDEIGDAKNLNISSTVKTMDSLDEEYRPYPLLAESISYEEDGYVCIVTVREDVLFSDGTPVTAIFFASYFIPFG